MESHPEGKYGESRTYEPDFKGPIKSRSCTDIICCLLFILLFVGLIAIGVIAFVHGDSRRLLYPTDSKSQICGVNIKEREQLVFFDIISCAKMGPALFMMGCPTPQVCVKTCPKKVWWWVTAEAQDRLERKLLGANAETNTRKDMICLNGNDGNHEDYLSKSITALIQDNQCAPYTYPSVSMMGRCMPKVIFDKFGNVFVTNTSLSDMQNRTLPKGSLANGGKFLSKFLQFYDVIQGVLDDLIKSWYFILIGCLLAMLLSLLWIFLLRLIATVMVVVTLCLFLGIFIFSTTYSFIKWNILRNETTKPAMKFTPNLTFYFKLETTWLVIGIISGVILLLIVILLIFLRDRIRVAIELIREASSCVGHMMLTMLWPLVPFIMQLVVLTLCIFIGVYLQSMGLPEGRLLGNYSNVNSINYTNASSESAETIDAIQRNIQKKFPTCDPQANMTGKLCQFVRYGSPQYVWILQFFNVFMFFWLFNFVIALGQVTLAGAFSSYYWAFVKPKDIPTAPILSSFWRSLRYHLGSLAFGSLILSIVQVIRLILEYIDNKLKGSENPVAKCLLKCMKCCFWCLEKFLRFLNKNAYIMIAIYGENFCTAGKNAFFLIMRNIVRVFVVDKVTDFLLFIGKLVVVGLVGSLAFFFFDGTLATKVGVSAMDLKYYLIPVIIVIIASYFIACAFFNVYSVAVDSLFLCFLEDLERNDGSTEKPYYMSSNMMKILGKKNMSLLQNNEDAKSPEADKKV